MQYFFVVCNSQLVGYHETIKQDMHGTLICLHGTGGMDY